MSGLPLRASLVPLVVQLGAANRSLARVIQNVVIDREVLFRIKSENRLCRSDFVRTQGAAVRCGSVLS